MKLLLDTGVLGQLCHPKQPENQPLAHWLARVLERGPGYMRIIIPEAAPTSFHRLSAHCVIAVDDCPPCASTERAKHAIIENEK